MKRELQQQYGPLLKEVPDLREYLWYSERAFLKTQKLAGSDPEDWGTVEGQVLQVLMLHALNASYSVRLLTTYAQTLEAYALLRTRLEQVIVCSYLIHSDEEDGFVPYVQDINRVDQRAVDSLDQDEELRDLLKEIAPQKFEFAKAIAELNEQSIDPDFDIENDRLKRKWTNLNTHDLALHRDRLAPEEDDIISVSLRRYYLTLYKSASIIVHSDTGALTENFLHVHRKGAHPSPRLAYLFINLINCAHFDILQCYEMLHHFDMPEKEQLAEHSQNFQQFIRDQL